LTVAYSVGDSRRTQYDTVQSSDTPYYPVGTATPPPTKYIYGAILASNMYDSIGQTQSRLIPTYKYDFVQTVKWWITIGNLKLIDA